MFQEITKGLPQAQITNSCVTQALAISTRRAVDWHYSHARHGEGDDCMDPVIDELDLRSAAPTTGVGLCLSGGGYRAMSFHLGALRRLNEAGLLATLTRISSVSGGSIIAALVGLRWNELRFEPVSGNETGEAPRGPRTRP